ADLEWSIPDSVQNKTRSISFLSSSEMTCFAALAAKVTGSCVKGAIAISSCPIPTVNLAGSTPRASAKSFISTYKCGAYNPILSIPIFTFILLLRLHLYFHIYVMKISNTILKQQNYFLILTV